ncbi:MAG: hypothetical protein ACO1RA_05810 [Planctomycetaceae bacterium]
MDAVSLSADWYLHFSSGGFPSGQVPQGSFSNAGGFGTQPPPQKSNFWMIFFVVVLVLLLICCGCGGAVVWFTYTGVQQVAGAIGGEVVKPYQNDPAVQEHIGNIQSANMNFTESANESQKAGGKNEGVLVFDVVGDKGKGKIIGRPSQDGQEQLLDTKLVLPNGQEFSIKAAPVPSDEGIQLPPGNSGDEAMEGPTSEQPETEPAEEPAGAASN